MPNIRISLASILAQPLFNLSAELYKRRFTATAAVPAA